MGDANVMREMYDLADKNGFTPRVITSVKIPDSSSYAHQQAAAKMMRAPKTEQQQ